MTKRLWTILLLCLGLLLPVAGCDSESSSRSKGDSHLSVRGKRAKKRGKKNRRANRGKRGKRKKHKRGRRGWARN